MGYFFVPWWMNDGPKSVWGTVGGITAALGVIGFIFYFWGKVFRAFWSRHHWLAIPDLKH